MTRSLACGPGQPGPDDALDRAASTMIRNGLYLAETRFLDGVEAYNRHVMVLRDGTMRGGGGFYYTVGSYTCSGGKWKGEMTSQEHSPIAGTYPWARKVMSIGFTGTYSDDGAEFEATALAGKQSFRFKSIYRLLFADWRRVTRSPGDEIRPAQGCHFSTLARSCDRPGEGGISLRPRRAGHA